MKTFDEEIIFEQAYRQRKEFEEMHKKEINGDYIYTRFCVWCNAYKNGQGKHDANIFAEYIKENNIKLNWWQRKRIAENYFNYKIEWNGKEWKSKKIKENK